MSRVSGLLRFGLVAALVGAVSGCMGTPEDEAAASASEELCTSSGLSATAYTATYSASAGQSITWTATSSCSVGSPQYYFTYRLPSGAWVAARPYATGASYVWDTTGLAVGVYSWQVWVRDGGSTASKETVTYGSFQILAQNACTSVSSTAAPTGAVMAGVPVNIDSLASCGSGSPTYRVLHQLPGSSAWAEVQAYSATARYTWTTAGATVGVHNFEVWSRASGSAAAKESFTALSVQIRAADACTAITSTALLGAVPVSGAVTAGDAVTIASTPTCGASQGTYRVLHGTVATGWAEVQSYPSTNANFVWDTTGAAVGWHYFQIWLRSAGSTAPKEAYASVSVQIRAQDPCTAVSASASIGATPVTGGVTVGDPVTVTSSPSCGRSTATYRIIYKAPAAATWTEVRSYPSTSASYLWDTTGAAVGLHAFQIWVRGDASTASKETYTEVDIQIRAQDPCTAVSSSAYIGATPVSGGVTVGDPVTITSSPSCGRSTATYRVMHQTPGSSTWTDVQSYPSTNPSYLWDTTGAALGLHSFQIWVRADASTAAKETYTQVDVLIRAQDPCTALTASATPGGAVALGNSVTINAAGNCGRSTPTYSILHKAPSDVGYTELQAYPSTNTAYAWSSAGAELGTHSFLVYLRGEGSAASYEQSVEVLVPVMASPSYVKASNTGASDNFGYVVAISADGTRMAVAAPLEDSNATGVGGDQANNGAADSGAVYVYALTGSTWAQEAYIKAPNTETGDDFGYSLSMSADGTRLAVGAIFEDSSATGIDGNSAGNAATDSGAVFVYARTGPTWAQEAYIKASNTDAGDVFGSSVSLSSDGTRLAVGAQYEASSATGVGGNQSDNAAVKAGAAYVFSRTGATWSQDAYLKASNTEANDDFGAAVALSGDGTRLAVSAIFEGSSATGIDGLQSDNSALQSGAVYMFAWSGSAWSQAAYVKASNAGAGDRFGRSLSLSADGSLFVVGAWREDSNATGVNGIETDNTASDSGAAYVFAWGGATWAQEAYIKASNTNATDYFGQSVSLSSDGTRLAVSGYWEDSSATGINGDQTNNGLLDSGAVYEFTRSGTTWTQADYVKSSNSGARDKFGQSVALSANGLWLAVGALEEDSAATGMNGDQADNASTDSGAVYLY